MKVHFEPGPATLRPRYDGASLANVMPSALACLGVPGARDTLGLRDGPFADVRAIIVLLIDGLGHELLPYATRQTASLRALAAGPGSRVITAGFPTTTPTSLTSLGTGSPPGAHGVLGFCLNVPGTDRLLNHIVWNGDPDPLVWQPLRTQFELAEQAGVAATVVSRGEFANTGLTVAAFRGAGFHGTTGIDSLADALLGAARTASRPTIIYGYHPDVDTAGHLHGVGTRQWRNAMAGADQLVELLLAALPPWAGLIVTGDHGQVNIPAANRFDLDSDPRLRDGLRVVAGEPRVRYLHTVPGARDQVIAMWRDILGGSAWVVSREEAIAQGWFGPVPEAHLQRIGDVIIACHEDYIVLATKTDPPRMARNIAFHGSATRAEMLVPLLISRRG